MLPPPPPPDTDEEFNSKLVGEQMLFLNIYRGPDLISGYRPADSPSDSNWARIVAWMSHSGKWTSALNQFTETNRPKESVWGKESYFPVCPRLWITGNNVVNDDHRLIFFLHKGSIYRQEKKGIRFFLPWYAFLTREVLVAADLHFMNHHGVQFQLKIFFTILLKEKVTYILSEQINNTFSFLGEVSL